MKSIDDLGDDEFERRLRDAVGLRDAPAALVHAAIALWPASASAPSTAVAVLRRLLAALSFDSAAPAPALRTVRGNGRPAARQLLFSTEGRDIDLRVEGRDGTFDLAGQVLGPDEAGRVDVTDALAAKAAVVGSAELDALGEFRVGGLPAGSYRIVLTLGSDEVTLPTVVLGSAAG